MHFTRLHSPHRNFLRRRNEDTDQIESVCKLCFQTIAKSKNRDVVELHEMQHDCPLHDPDMWPEPEKHPL